MNFSLGHKGSSVEEAADAYVPALNAKVNGRRLLWDVLAKIWQCGQTIFYSSPVSVFYYFSFLFNLSCKRPYSFCVCGCVVHVCPPVCHSVCVCVDVFACIHNYIYTWVSWRFDAPQLHCLTALTSHHLPCEKPGVAVHLWVEWQMCCCHHFLWRLSCLFTDGRFYNEKTSSASFGLSLKWLFEIKMKRKVLTRFLEKHWKQFLAMARI